MDEFLSHSSDPFRTPTMALEALTVSMGTLRNSMQMGIFMKYRGRRISKVGKQDICEKMGIVMVV